MKNLIKLRYSITVFIILLLTSSCDLKKVTEDIEITISNNILKQQVLITIYDITNPENLEGLNKLNVEVIGPDSDKFVTNSGNNISKLKVIDGNISLGINPNLSSSFPLKVTLKITGSDYLSTTIPLVMFPDDTLISKSINIVNKLNTVQGVDFTKNTKTLLNSTLDSDYEIETPRSKATTNSTVKIKAETIFKDKNGNIINGTELTVELAHFSLDTPESIGSFPGGLTPNSVIDENGVNIEDSSFISAGFTSIDMYVDGTEIKEFSKPIIIGIEIPNDYINPETGNIITIGDVIPIWSYDDNGQWGYHQTGIVETNSSNNLCIKFSTTHLSWYNLDFHIYGCNERRKLNVNLPKETSLDNDNYNLTYDLVYAHNNQIVANNRIKFSKNKNNASGFYRTPNSNLKLKVYSGEYSNRVLLYTSEIFNGCNSNNITLNSSLIARNLPELPQIKNINIEYKTYCGSKILKPYFYIYKYKTYNYYGHIYKRWRWIGYSYNGKGVIYNAKIGESEKYRIYYGGKTYEYNFTFNSDNIILDDFQIPQGICDNLF